jgi:hypothetical protein
VFDHLALRRPTNDRDGLSKSLQGMIVRLTVEPLDHLRSAHPEAEHETATAEVVERDGRHGGHRRRPRRHLQHTAGQPDA